MAVFRTVSLHINPNLCQLCPRCAAVKACRTKAIVQIDPGEIPYLEASRCRDCWLCIPACTNGAIQKLNKET
jgi:Fe-S-cluster-containing hydrogenase component 2